MGHLLAHPFLMMLYEVDNDHGTATAADAAEFCDGLLRIRQKVQHHDTKRSVYAARLQRQFQSVTAAEFDIAELSLLSDHSCSPKHFLCDIHPNDFLGKSRSLNGQAPGSAADVGKDKVARQQFFDGHGGDAIVKIALANALPVTRHRFKIAL